MRDKFQRKRIFINARFLTQPVTGVQRYGHELVKGLDNLIEQGDIDLRGAAIELLAPRKGILFRPDLKHIPLRQVGCLTGHAWEQLELPHYAKEGLLFCPGNTAPVTSMVTGRPTVVTVHSLSFIYFPEAYSFAFRALYNTLIPMVMSKADAVITVAESEKVLIGSRFPQAADKIYAVQNGGLPREVREKSGQAWLPDPEVRESAAGGGAWPHLLYVGSRSKGKNLQGVLQALAILNEKFPVKLTVVGAGGKSFKDAGLSIPSSIIDKVEFAGRIDDIAKLIALYKTAKALVFPSFYEASSLPPVEAMACGCPVVVSDIPALRERCGDAALYCDPADADDIAGKIALILEDAGLAEDLRQRGIARAKQYTWENCARETFRIINDVLLKRK